MSLSQAIRKSRGSMTQHAYANYLGCSIPALQRWEAGRATPTGYLHIERLMERGVPRSLLMPSEDTRSAHPDPHTHIA